MKEISTQLLNTINWKINLLGDLVRAKTSFNINADCAEIISLVAAFKFCLEHSAPKPLVRKGANTDVDLAVGILNKRVSRLSEIWESTARLDILESGIKEVKETLETVQALINAGGGK